MPHSDISGSTPACGSPKLIAACHVLHRLPVPRHPSCALCNLTTKTSKRVAVGKHIWCLTTCVRPGRPRATPARRPARPELPETDTVTPYSLCAVVNEPDTERFAPPPLPRPEADTRLPAWGMVELRGFEPLASSLQSWRSSQLSYSPVRDSRTPEFRWTRGCEHGPPGGDKDCLAEPGRFPENWTVRWFQASCLVFPGTDLAVRAGCSLERR